MTLSLIARLSTVAVLLGGAALNAQIPKDNDVWKMRCNVLASAEQGIEAGKIPAPLLTATRGVPASKFITFALDRSGMGEHNVSCAMFYMAAIANRLGNGGKVDPSAAHDATVLANAEIKVAHGQSLSFSDKIKQTTARANELLTPSLTAAELTAVIQAASTMPLSLTAPAQSAQLTRPVTSSRSGR